MGRTNWEGVDVTIGKSAKKTQTEFARVFQAKEQSFRDKKETLHVGQRRSKEIYARSVILRKTRKT